jgi:sarcosine oxidase subunit beta
MGITDVAIVEMDQVGGGTSSKSSSMLSLQFSHDELTFRMAKYSYAKYMTFEEELGVPIDFKKIGWVFLATERTSAHLLRRVELLQSLGVRIDILEPDQIRHEYPEINTDDLALGTFGPDDGSLDPHMIMWGYNKRAAEMGVRLYEGARATGISVQEGRVVGVHTTGGFVSTEVVVNAGGPWAIEIGRWAGIEIPILNSARTVMVTGPFPEIPSNRPFAYDLTAEWYFRPEGPGILMAMGTEPTEELQMQTSHEMIDEMIGVAVHRVPVLAKASMLTAWTGIRPMTPDDHPIVGPVPSVDGLVLNCGWNGAGIIQAPIAGQLVAEYVSNHHTSTLDLGPLSIQRFKERSTIS